MGRAATAQDRQDGAPHRRRLLFVPGFDPRRPTVYHDMWVEGAAAQRLTTGADITVGPRRRAGSESLAWSVETVFDGRPARTEVELMRWDDLVRGQWLKGDAEVIRETPAWVIPAARAGVFGLTRRLARPLYLCLMVPPLLLSLMIVTALLLAAATGALIHPLAALVVLAAAPFASVAGWRAVDRWINTNWLVQCFSHVVRTKADPSPAMVARSAAFAERIIAAADDPEVDEVLLVGFSLGANLGVRALGEALAARPDLGRGRVAVNLLTLGQSINICRRLPGDAGFDIAFDRVASDVSVGWVDATSATDPASTCTMSPVEGMAAAIPGRPERRPPRFHKVLTPERYRAIRRDPNAFHFQYLRAVDLPGGWDWFRIAAGPDPLVERKTP